MNLYLLMSALFVIVAILGAVDASLTSLNLLPWFNGLRWLRVHLITLGTMTEAIFGLLPIVAAIRASLPRPSFRWGIWLTLNAGIVTLLIGIPIINQALIFSGGTLVFVATLLLMQQLRAMGRARPSHPVRTNESQTGRAFFLAGLGYFLLGIIIGTGLWLGWNNVLHMKNPIEVHIHANNWGFMSLVFAGLLVELYPKVAQRPFPPPHHPNNNNILADVKEQPCALGN